MLIALYPVDGGEPRVLDGVAASWQVTRFTPDGRFLYLTEESAGRRESIAWKSRAGGGLENDRPLGSCWIVVNLRRQISDDGESYYYTFNRSDSDLTLVSS